MPIKHLAPAIIITFTLLAFIFPEWLTALEFNHQAIKQGELWRLLTGHFYHTNDIHMVLNIGALILLWGLHHRYYSLQKYLILFVLISLATSIALLQFSDILLYVGLSGVLHGMFIHGALSDINYGDKTGYLLLIGAIFKIGHEQVFGASSQVESLINANVAIDAHLYGAIAGLIIYFVKKQQMSKN